jgi:hypothetical protein
VDAWFNVKIHDIEHSYGFITVGWSYQTNSRRPTTHKNGTESFTIAEALKICMTDGTTDQLGRKLPLPGHHEDCEYGQNGWSMCYCEEIDKIKQAEDGWKVCMQDSYGNRQYECLKCHYVTKWVKDHSELATAKEHACPSPIDRAFDNLEI